MKEGGVYDYFALLRPHQWVKNLFIFPALIFSKNLFHPVYLLKSVAAFALFCMLAGSVYVLNDVVDADEDRHHPLKRLRPIASGRVGVKTAYLLHGVLASLSLALSVLLNPYFGAIAFLYYTLNVAYSLGLKRVVILDVMIVSLGFVIRAAAGGLVISVTVSPWLLVCTMLLALFLVLAKRRHEIILLEGGEDMSKEPSTEAGAAGFTGRYRRSLDEYNPYFLDQLIGVTTASTLIAYILYTLSEDAVQHFGGTGLIYTVPFVIYGIFRYLYLMHLRKEGGSPTRALFGDPPLMADIALWGLCVVFVLYL